MKIKTLPDQNLAAPAGAEHLLAQVERLERENLRLRRLLLFRTRQEAPMGISKTKH